MEDWEEMAIEIEIEIEIENEAPQCFTPGMKRFS